MYNARHLKDKKHCINLFEHNLTYIVFDTETTGKEKDAYIVELAADKYEVKDKRVVKIDSIDLYIRPPYMMSPSVIAVHGITNERLKNEPEERDVIDKIESFFDRSCVLVGYNTDFDIEKMEEMYKRCGKEFYYPAKVDALDFARDILFGQAENFSLSSVITYLGLDQGIQFHSAADDIEATQRFLRYCYTEYVERIEKPHSEQLYINYCHYWKGHNKEQAGIWVNTNRGKLYFSTYYKRWFSNEINLDFIDIDALESYLLTKLGITYREFEKLTEKKYKEITKK